MIKRSKVKFQLPLIHISPQFAATKLLIVFRFLIFAAGSKGRSISCVKTCAWLNYRGVIKLTSIFSYMLGHVSLKWALQYLLL